MRLKINFQNMTSNLTVLPSHYNYHIQGFIYHHLSDWMAKLFHDKGITDPITDRRYKMFTFSRLIPEGKFTVENKRLLIHGRINLTISSPFHDFIESIATKLINTQKFNIADQTFLVNSLSVEGIPQYKEQILVRTLSPITVYETHLDTNGKKITKYLSPFDKEFEKQIIDNLSKKLRALTGQEINNGSIKPVSVNEKNQKIIIYKGTVIKGWDGVFELRLPEPLFNLAFDTGLGSKNSQGFGCIEALRD